ncbi:TPR repeat-containing protein [Desulfotomaculum arcticum]|uniref:TPR repeat-containing protein n=1 Tax=Desulfotruncus arcticus DSM 17038 TaxID=1121424 RepID=A0A1I2WZP5_9FIRM|nr:O-antigen ligase family protein [Desulfotruncus arcticus]SFH06745.1 TPR repeat-containing protein [Desulfotomaculum arcticum] [Desulfotruncus arcticus DSM 17038]
MTAKRKKAIKESPKGREQAGKQELDVLHQIAFWGLALLLFFPPYFQGLFFAPEQEKALIFATLVFWLTFLWRWLQNDHKLLRSPLDWFALALPVIYIISSFTAVNKGLAIDEVVKNILYFLTYWSVSRLVRNEEDIHKLLHVMYISAIGVALAGLATATELIHINDGFNVTEYGGTISSTFQYHNALAVYLGAVFFIGIHLWHRSNGRGRAFLAAPLGAGQAIELKLARLNPMGYLYACGNFLLLAVLIGSKSRAGLLVFGLVFVIYLIGAGNERRLTASLATGCLGAAAYVVIDKFILLAQNKQHDQAWLWIVGGLVLALAWQLAYNLLNRYVFDRWAGDGKKFILTFAALAVIVIIAGGIWASGKTQVFEKVTSPEYLENAFQRVYYMGSAAEMIKERPLLGWGGGGWKEAYEAYLSYRYTTREVHSYYFQVGVETAIPGVIIVFGIWLSFLVLACRLFLTNKMNDTHRQLVWLFAVVFLMIAGHALIDFDLSLSAITIGLWSIMGMTLGLLRLDKAEEPRRAKQATFNYAPVAAVTTVMLIVILICAGLLNASKLYNQGMYYLRANNAAGGIESLEKATGYNPFNADYRVILSQVYSGLGKSDDAMAEARAAVDLSPYSFAVRNNLVKVAIASGKNELAVGEIKNTLSQAPNNIEVYEAYAQNYVNLGVKELISGKKDAAREHFNKVAGVVKLVNEQAASLNGKDIAMWQGPKLAVNDNIQLALGQAGYFLGNQPEAQKYLQQAAKSGKKEIKGQALLWQALLNEKNGRAEQAQKMLDEANKIAPEYDQQYQSLKEIPVL